MFVERINKKEKGITMIALVITIIVLLILATITITTGVINTKGTKDVVLEAELKMIHHAVLERYTKWKVTKKDDALVGKAIENSQKVQEILDKTTSGEKVKVNYDSLEGIPIENRYYEMDEKDLEQIGVKKAKYNYIVNYRTGEVINKTKLKTSAGNPLYISGINDEIDNGKVEEVIEISLQSGPTKVEYATSEDVNYDGIKIKKHSNINGDEIIDGVPYVINCETNNDSKNPIRYTITVKYDDEHIWTIETYKKGWYGELLTQYPDRKWYRWYYYMNNGQRPPYDQEVTLPKTGNIGETQNWWYYFKSEEKGEMYVGWLYDEAKDKWKYYLDYGVRTDPIQNYEELKSKGYNQGARLTDVWGKVKNYWYHFDSNGWMQEGWLKLGETWYYLKPAGFTGWSGPRGSMLYNTTVNIEGKNYNFNSSGACTNP